MCKEEGIFTFWLKFLYNLFTFFASVYHSNNFSKDVIHLRKIKGSQQQKQQLRGPSGSETAAEQPQEAERHPGGPGEGPKAALHQPRWQWS